MKKKKETTQRKKKKHTRPKIRKRIREKMQIPKTILSGGYVSILQLIEKQVNRFDADRVAEAIMIVNQAIGMPTYRGCAEVLRSLPGSATVLQ